MAEEIAQDTLCRLYARLPRYRGDAAFGTFIYKICRNAAMDALRSRSRERKRGPFIRERAMKDLPSSLPGSDKTVERRFERRALFHALNRMDEKERSLLYLKEAEGIGIAELARIFGIPPGTVKSRLFRAREKLRSGLKEDGYDFD